MITCTNPEAVAWANDYAEGIFIKGNEIKSFPGGLPTQTQVDQWEADYLAAFPVLSGLEQAKKDALEVLNKNFSECSAQCRGYYDSPEERETWDQQKKEAEEYTSNPLTVTPFMNAFILANPNMTKAQLATTILANAAAMAAAAGDLGGQLSAKRAEVLAAVDEADVNAVDLTFTMPSISLLDK